MNCWFTKKKKKLSAECSDRCGSKETLLTLNGYSMQYFQDYFVDFESLYWPHVAHNCMSSSLKRKPIED